jgi:hypothetical protein
MSAYDPPLISDADLEMAEAAEIGAAIHARQKQGICCHLSAVGYVGRVIYPEQEGLLPGQVRCRDGCGTVFASDEEWQETMMQTIEG